MTPTENATTTLNREPTNSAADLKAADLSAPEVSRIRADFPALDQMVNGHPLAYLDSGATAQRPRAVLDAERRFLETVNAAVHRGAHTLAALSTEEFEAARETVAHFIGARPDEIVWTSNATDALNLIASGIANASRGRGGPDSARLALKPGDEILITEAEHHANLIPWQELAVATGAVLRWIPLRDDGTFTLEDAAAAMTERVRIFAFAHISNVTGSVAPVAELVELAHAAGAITVLDACQSAPHRRLSVAELGVDFAAFSGHKMLGPTGVGVLYGRAELLAALPPVRTGGSMITTVTMERTEFLDPPQRFEAGTQPVSQAIALAEAIRYLDGVGLDRIEAHERRLAQTMLAGLSSIPGVRTVGPVVGEDRAGLVSFDIAGVHAHDVGQFLDAQGIAVRVGHHCAQPLHRRLGLTATTRASTYLYTTDADVERLLESVAGVRAYFGAAS